MIAVLRELAVAAGTAAVRALVKLITRKSAEHDQEQHAEPPHPTWKDVEHQREQMNASIAAGKELAAQRETQKRLSDTQPLPPPRRRRPLE